MVFRYYLKSLLRNYGYDIVKYNYITSSDLRSISLIQHNKVNLILDIGANKGQYTMRLRRAGYKGKIISFEPISSIFTELKNQVKKDIKWKAVNIALGNYDGKIKINISKNSESNSILNILPRHIKSDPKSVYVGSEEVTIKKLDSIFSKYIDFHDRTFMKLDTQGYEINILEGASKSLENIIGIQIEMSLVSLYKGDKLFLDVTKYLYNKGFLLMSLEPVFCDSLTGQLLQVDGIFFRK